MQTGPQQEEMGHAKERKNEWAVQEQLNRLEEEKGFGMDYKMIFFRKRLFMKIINLVYKIIHNFIS
jgi:hypothetical protein